MRAVRGNRWHWTQGSLKTSSWTVWRPTWVFKSSRLQRRFAKTSKRFEWIGLFIASPHRRLASKSLFNFIKATHSHFPIELIPSGDDYVDSRDKPSYFEPCWLEYTFLKMKDCIVKNFILIFFIPQFERDNFKKAERAHRLGFWCVEMTSFLRLDWTHLYVRSYNVPRESHLASNLSIQTSMDPSVAVELDGNLVRSSPMFHEDSLLQLNCPSHKNDLGQFYYDDLTASASLVLGIPLVFFDFPKCGRISIHQRSNVIQIQFLFLRPKGWIITRR